MGGAAPISADWKQVYLGSWRHFHLACEQPRILIHVRPRGAIVANEPVGIAAVASGSAVRSTRLLIRPPKPKPHVSRFLVADAETWRQ